MADDGLTGPELWNYDGVSVSQVADINSGYSGSIPMPLREFSNSYYFSADDALFGNELWRLDPGIATAPLYLHHATGQQRCLVVDLAGRNDQDPPIHNRRRGAAASATTSQIAAPPGCRQRARSSRSTTPMSAAGPMCPRGITG